MKKNDKNKAFLMREEYEDMFKMLGPAESYDMLMKMFGYFKRQEDPEDLTRKQTVFWALAKQHVDGDIRRYEEKVEKNRANAQKRYATASDGMQSHPMAANKTKEKKIKENEISLNYPSKDNSKIDRNNKTGIEPSPPGDRLSSKPSDKPSEEEIAALQNRFMNKRRNRQSSEDREAHLQSIGFYDMTAAEKIAYLEEERRRKRANS